MPTNRTPINRLSRSHITPEIIALYLRMVAERAILWKQCTLDQKLGDMLGFPVWQRTSIGDIIGYEGDEPPADVGYISNPGMAQNPRAAAQIRCRG